MGFLNWTDDKYVAHFGDCIAFMQEMVNNGVRVEAIVTDPPYLYLDHRLDRDFDEERFFTLCSMLTDKIVFFGRGDSFYKWNAICKDLGFEFKEELIWYKGANCLSAPTLPIGRVHETISVRMKKGNSINKVRVDKTKQDFYSMSMDSTFATLKKLARETKNENFLHYLRKNEILYNIGGGRRGEIVGSAKMKADPVVTSAVAMLEGSLLRTVLHEKREQVSIEEGHPTQKPYKLINPLIELVSKEGDIIFDPFMGSGSTGVSAIDRKRRFIGCEIDTEYFGLSSRRLKEKVRNKKMSIFEGI